MRNQLYQMMMMTRVSVVVYMYSEASLIQAVWYILLSVSQKCP